MKAIGRTFPPLPPPDPDKIRDAFEALIDFAQGASEAEPDEQAVKGVEAVAEGQAKGAAAEAWAQRMIPFKGPVAKMTRDLIAKGLELPLSGVEAPVVGSSARDPSQAPAGAQAGTVWERDYEAISDPYYPLDVRARQAGRRVTDEDRRAYGMLPEVQMREQRYSAMATAARERLDGAYARARRQGVDPTFDPEVQFWDSRLTNILRLRDQASAEWLRQMDQSAARPAR